MTILLLKVRNNLQMKEKFANKTIMKPPLLHRVRERDAWNVRVCWCVRERCRVCVCECVTQRERVCVCA